MKVHFLSGLITKPKCEEEKAISHVDSKCIVPVSDCLVVCCAFGRSPHLNGKVGFVSCIIE
jgi:hypothetical protein